MQHPLATDRSARPLSTGLVWLESRIEQFIASGGRAVVLVGPPGSGKVRLADAVLSGLPGRQTRIGNPTSRPLSMKRMLQQIGMPADEGTDGPFLGMLAEQAYDDQSAVVMVHQAHTLSPYALSALSRVPGLGGPEHPGMILMLAGEAPLLAKLSAPGLDVLRNARRTLVLMMPRGGAAEEVGVARLTWMALLPEGGDADAAARTGRRRFPPIRADRPPLPDVPLAPPPKRPPPPPPGLLMLVAAMTAAVILGWMVWPEPAPSRSAAAPVLPPPMGRVAAEQPRPDLPMPAPAGTSTEPPAPALDAATLPTPDLAAPGPTPGSAAELAPAPVPEPLPGRTPEPAPEPATEITSAITPEVTPEPAPEPTPAQIKREFDAFLNRAGRDTAKLTPAARAALFREYLQWRIRATLAGP